MYLALVVPSNGLKFRHNVPCKIFTVPRFEISSMAPVKGLVLNVYYILAKYGKIPSFHGQKNIPKNVNILVFPICNDRT